ncbi:hypothetical protein K469DRAFT_658880 [Zopfia rhizophila CBS 207.26]|uniref:DUF7905 domain-containing protein n=1 Tax=Zopfia rhizophila CBS 207.26 TaxID=1314779 RepID=A0A6A6EGR0_9PEZI|nr:hypothetical protein K469DRAFT_658880 [Zopfia rhizophila CBS 207.26]
MSVPNGRHSQPHANSTGPQTPGRDRPAKKVDAKPWGERKKPQREVVVPSEFRPAVRYDDLERIANTISLESGSHVVPSVSKGEPLRFLIYGQGTALDDAIRCVNQFIDRARTKTAASTTWAKLKAFDANEWCRNELKVMEDQHKAQFKTAPSEEEPPPCKVIVGWSDDLQLRGVSPRDAFGGQLEALDPIRTSDEVFISLTRKMQLTIEGYHPSNVQDAEEHIQNLVRKVEGTFFKPEPINFILDHTEGIDVLLHGIKDWPIQSNELIPQLKVSPMMDEHGYFRNRDIDPALLARVQHQLLCVLESVRYERGTYDLVIRYGCLAVGGLKKEERGNKYSVEGFQMGISRAKITLRVTKWLGDRQLENNLLDRLMAAEHLLEPVGSSGSSASMFAPGKLQNVRPIFRGTWLLEDLNSPNVAQAIVIQIDWTEDEEGYYEKMAPQFFKLRQEKVLPEDHLDINLMELGDARGWHFGLESMQAISKSTVSRALVGFADRVRMSPECAKDFKSTKAFAIWDFPGFKSLGSRLDKVYTFGIKETRYEVEALTMWYPRAAPCWGIFVRHRDWKMLLNPLEKLPPGHSVSFGDTFQSFLPDDGLASVSTQGTSKSLSELVKMKGGELPPAGKGIKLLAEKLIKLSGVINGY